MRKFMLLIFLSSWIAVTAKAQNSGSTTVDDVQLWSGSDATASMGLTDSQTMTLDTSVTLDTGFDVDESSRIYAEHSLDTWDVTVGATFTISVGATDNHIVDVFASLRSQNDMNNADDISDLYLELDHRFASTESVTGIITIQRYFEFSVPYTSGNVGEYLFIRIESYWNDDSVANYYAYDVPPIQLLGGSESDWATPVPVTNTPTQAATWTPTQTPTITDTPTAVLTPPTFTHTPVPPTEIPPSPTPEPVEPTFTEVPTFTPTIPTNTPTPVATHTPRVPTPSVKRQRLPDPELTLAEYSDQVLQLGIYLSGSIYEHEALKQFEISIYDEDEGRMEQHTLKASGGVYSFETLSDGEYSARVRAETDDIVNWASSNLVKANITLVNQPTPVPAPTHNPFVIDWQQLDPDPLFSNVQFEDMPDYPKPVPTFIVDGAVRRVDTAFKVWDETDDTWVPFGGKTMVAKLEEEDQILLVKELVQMTSGSTKFEWTLEGWNDETSIYYGRRLERFKVTRKYRDYTEDTVAEYSSWGVGGVFGFKRLSFDLPSDETWDGTETILVEVWLDKIQGIPTWTPTPYPLVDEIGEDDEITSFNYYDNI